MKKLQQAADDVGAIAETVEALGTMLDQFHIAHGAALYERLEAAWPIANEFGGNAPKPLFDLERALTPPDEYDTEQQRRLLQFVIFG